MTRYLQVWALLVGETQLIQQNTTKMVIIQACGNDAKCTQVNRTDPTMEARAKFSNTAKYKGPFSGHTLTHMPTMLNGIHLH